MNTYLAARTRRSAFKVTRWTIKVDARSSTEAAQIASKRLKPKAGQAVWVNFLRARLNARTEGWEK